MEINYHCQEEQANGLTFKKYFISVIVEISYF